MPKTARLTPTRIPLEEAVGVSSAGFVGATPDEARQNWAEESRHKLTGPGAYEWWYFQALSEAGNGVMITLFEGLPFHPRYLTQISRFSHRLGSAVFARPWPSLQASRYPAAYVAIYEGGKRVAQFLNLYPADSTTSTANDIRVGPNRITLRHDGSFGIFVKGYPYTTSHGRPRTRTNQILSASLTFTPTFHSVQHVRPFRAPDRTGAGHHWVLTAPHGRMTGNVRVMETETCEPILEQTVDTIGYHDHVYGDGGLATGVNTLLWGFLQGDNWTAAWHQTPSSKKTPATDGLVFFEEGHKPIVIDAPEVVMTKPSFSNWLLKHPGRINMHGCDAHGHPLELLLTHSHVLDTAPFHTRLAATGTITIPGRRTGSTFTGRGTTHVLKLRRLRWPVLSDLILLAITPISRHDPIWNL